MALTHSVLDGFYQLRETIGSGGFAKVKAAYHVSTNEKVAIKIIDKQSEEVKDEMQRIYNEIEVLKQLRHQNICQLYQVIETESHVYLVMEYCSEGELFDYIVSRTHLTEADARYHFRQILSALAYTHKKGIAHRDLKPENLLLDEDQNCKLIDFGLCAQPKNGLNVPLMTCCGSPAYAAPEVISGLNYSGVEVDVWSLGVLLYALLCGYLPFEDENIGNLFRKIQRGLYDVPNWLSNKSVDLLSQMLCVDPALRISVSELCVHPWVTYGYNDTPVRSESRLERRDLDNDCVVELAASNGISKARMTAALEEWKFDFMTATYLILLNRKDRGLPVVLANSRHFLLKSPFKAERRPLSMNLERAVFDQPTAGFASNSPGFSDYYANKENLASSPGPSLPPTPGFAVPATPPRRVGTGGPLSPSRSIDSQMTQRARNQQADGFASPSKSSTRDDLDGEARCSPRTPRTPLTRAVFGSLERHMDRVRQLITPKRKNSSGDVNGCGAALRKVISKHNVTPYAADYTPESVLNRLVAALEHRCINYTRRGFVLRCQLSSDWKQVLLAFDLEVCLISKTTQQVGVRRKRVKGDTWHYKRLCEDILLLAQESPEC